MLLYIHILHTLISLLSLTLLTGLVNTLATLNADGTYSNCTLPFCTSALTKWYLMTMCLDLWCCKGFLTKPIELCLSTYKVITLLSLLEADMTYSNCLRNLISCISPAKAMYSASKVLSAIWFVVFNSSLKSMDHCHITGNRNQWCCIYLHPQSALQKPLSCSGTSDFWNFKPWFIVPLMYRKTCLAIVRWQKCWFRHMLWQICYNVTEIRPHSCRYIN